ncbi:brefeldin A-inhibited guanine nucleotide-exchange protein 3 [Trichogramma pretiosum]|uniref:brefeldin A-inhibited guanine nucleotide-exchange protein 3 n=1 Tax=Trichogramma pretiosum TaxID=7493 RepID=UPI0006C971F0|nr:brefeldin A-inhibited guanine nucleotide-exchange protein 3 [Trichogramma pretiosum]
MEDLLQQIVKEAHSSKLFALEKAAQDACDFLDKQQGLLRDPPYELRAKCLRAVQLTLETRRSKFVAFGLTGLHRMLRDDRFQSPYEPEDDSLWLPAQMLHAMGSILSQPDDAQTDMLKVLLQVACCPYWTMNGRLIIATLTTCCEAFEHGNQAVKTAAQAATSQTLRSFCLFLDEECREMDENARRNKNVRERGVSCFNEALPILQYICCKLDEAQNARNGSTVVFLLECLHTLISSLPAKIHTNCHFTTFLWQKFCPALIAFLGTPRVDKSFQSREHPHQGGGNRGGGEPTPELGRGSGYLATSLGFDSHQAKTVYCIGTELVRIVGCVGPLRPVLESVFHRMLLYPPPQQRLESLKALKELLRSPSRIADFAGPLLVDDDKSSQLQSDMALMRLAMDSIEESTSGGLAVLQASVSCVVALLSALQELCDGKAISHEYTCAINALYEDLESCDYRGPLTYQSMARLPKTYREQLELMKKTSTQKATDSDSSGRGPSEEEDDDDVEDGNSTDTEGPPTEEQTTTTTTTIADDAASVQIEDSSDSYDLANERERERLEKLPKCLHVGRQFVEECNVDVERHNARMFVKTLKQDLIPQVLGLRSIIEVDEALQSFASRYCQGVYAAQQRTTETSSSNDDDDCALITIMNADGIYLATYAALLLNLKLIRQNYYEDDSSKLLVTEGQFVEEVHGSGVLVYLSATWLSELYQQVLASNLLAKCGYDPRSQDNNALVNALIDVDGIPGTRPGGQLLSDYLRLERCQLQRQEATPESEAGTKLARRVLTCCWASIVNVLASGLNPCRDELLSKGLLTKDDGKKGIKDTITLALEGLQRVASLSNVLGLQARCGTIFALLAKAACSEQLISRLRRTKDVLRLKLQNRATNLHTSHATSMDVLLSKGLELSSHGSDCWPHVFTCCLYVSKLEHDFFGKNQQNVSIAKSSSSGVKKEKKEPPLSSSECKTNQERLKLSFNMVGDDDEDDAACVDVYSFLSTPYTQSSAQDSVAEIIQQSNADQQFNGILPSEYAAKIVCALSQQVDRLFEDAALKLNLRALCLFLQALCRSSKDQLFKSQGSDSKSKDRIWWRMRSNSGSNSNKPRDEELNTLLLSRLGEVMLKCVKSGRPLIHAMRAWSILGPHFMEAACHKDRAISKKAVECIYDSMAALLNDQLELPHFHFNEALFKPFENLLCLELCDPDVQDQIVSCICEFVETNRTEIRSGWRPLFGALKVATVGQAESVESAPLLEVFRVFLSTDNPLVFANAALDCILCLLKHVRGCSDTETSTPTKTTAPPQTKSDKNSQDRSAENDVENGDKGRKTKLCLESLKYLVSCSELLANMYRMPACPIFHSAQRVPRASSSASLPQYVDPSLPNDGEIIAGSLHDASYELLTNPQPAESHKLASLQALDQPSGVLGVWYSLIEGLASATMICPRAYQPHALETLFHLLRSTLETPGPLFGLYCVNHLLLPMVQNWLRKTSRISRGWDSFASNFKQCCGLTTDLVVDFIEHLQGPKAERDETYLSLSTLMVKQLFLVMTECIVQPTESIARLGCACIRHVLVSSGPILTADQWEVCGVTCHRACSSSLQQLHQLTMAFSPYSESFYGDTAQVKVAARRDATPEETERLRQLAAQVFLLEEQRREELNQLLDEKSYVFQLYSPSVAVDKNPELYSLRIQMRALIVGLLVHQMLLQCIATVLLQNADAWVPRLPQLLMKSVTSLPKSHSSTRTSPQLEPRHVNVFLSALDLSYVAALKFDSRPGLKFLLQKVANLQRPANLYHQACTAWTIKIVALFDLSLAEIGKCGADLKQTKRLVLNDSKSENKFKRLVGYMTQLRTTFDELCGTYVDIALDRDGRYTVADTIAERKFFLLVSQPDDYTELPEEEEAPKNNRIVYSASPENEKPAVAKETTPRPFRLSDLASDSSTDSGPQSEPESDDSRPESPSDLNDSQIVFLDRHREAADKTSVVDENQTTEEAKKAENNGTERVEAKKAKRRKKKRGSDDCLLSRRYNLKFIQKDELESYAKKQSLYFRSKSMLELHHHRSAAQRVGGAANVNHDEDDDNDESGATATGSAAEKLSNEEALEDIAALIREYEHNRRGFSTNPFLQDERRKTGSLDLDDYCREANKDSETRRRAWAETIGTSLEFALALPDELLAPLLPVLVGGIRILTRHAYEPVLKQHLAVFFRRIGHIYGLVDATPAT